MSNIRTTVKCDKCKAYFEVMETDATVIATFKKHKNGTSGWLLGVCSGWDPDTNENSYDGVSISAIDPDYDMCLSCTIAATLKALRLGSECLTARDDEGTPQPVGMPS